MNDPVEQEKKRAYKRMLIGAALGIFLFSGSSAFYFWNSGAFEKIPMFTMPPGLAVVFFGFIGAILGAFLSLFSRSWQK